MAERGAEKLSNLDNNKVPIGVVHSESGAPSGPIRAITKLPNSEQSSKGKVKTHKYINRKNQSTTENYENRNDPHLVQVFLKKWWVESNLKAPNLPFSLRLKGSGCHYSSIFNNTGTK